jgi:hypothetical protein
MIEPLSSLIAAVPSSGALPIPLDHYPAMEGAGLLATLSARAAAVPFNRVATGIFLIAIVHTLFAQRFAALAHRMEERHAERARAAGQEPQASFHAEVFHFFGEVEVVFGLWAVVLLLAIVRYYGWATAQDYLGHGVNYTEALFVVVIMTLASTRPILVLAEGMLRRIAGLGRGTPAAWWLTILTVSPLLGSVITEPAAMTIGALLLSQQFYALQPSRKLAYATLGLLFVNVSVGGTLTHFAAPPVLMVARPWGWDTGYMLSAFGPSAVLTIVTSSALYFLFFRRELLQLEAPPAAAAPVRVPAGVILVHVAFMAWTVLNSHYPPLFVGGFLFFLGFARATSPHQGPIDLKPPLLVGFFLAALVTHGTLQAWWIEPVLRSLGERPLFLGALALTAVNDNALITYLATLVPSLGAALKFAVVAGAVSGGGLTVIANAPNPAGQAILGHHFKDGISPLGLLAGALLPTAVAALVFLLLG